MLYATRRNDRRFERRVKMRWFADFAALSAVSATIWETHLQRETRWADAQVRLIGFVDEDKRSPLHHWRARAHEGDLDIFDLAFTRPS